MKKPLTKKTLILHGGYPVSLVVALVIMVVGVYVAYFGAVRTLQSFSLFSLEAIVALVLLLGVLVIVGVRAGLLAAIDSVRIMVRLSAGRYELRESAVRDTGECRSCCGGATGTGMSLHDGSVYVDNSGRDVSYEPDDAVYLLYLEGETLPLDVFKVSDFQLV